MSPPRKQKPSPLVVLRNITRTSLNFRVPGRSIALMPGQSAELPEAYLETRELGRLHRAGALAKVEAPPTARPATAQSEAASPEKKDEP